MGIIQTKQAIFASSERGRIKGYQLVAKSAGIDRTTVQELCRWAPSQVPSDDPALWTINYFPVSNDSVAVTRTVLGGPEYSGRGGTQVVTLILVLSNDQFVSYACNPVAVAQTALSMGYLRLPLDSECQHLPLVELPSQPFIDPSADVDTIEEGYEDMLDQVIGLLNETQRVAVIGMPDPIDAIGRLIPRLSLESRRHLSFTTGLSPTVRRPFQVHFLPSADLTRQRALDAQHIVRVDAS